MSRTVYLNHAGTTWPKPQCVIDACHAALNESPTSWADSFDRDFQKVASAFGLSDNDELLLTPGCTSALHVAVADHDWQAGDRVLCSGFEHHALYRPLQQLVDRGVELVVVPPSIDSLVDLNRLEEALKKPPKLVALTAACNVTGDLLPVTEIGKLTHQAGSTLLVDGAQAAGWETIDFANSPIDLLTFAGHKALHAPWGIGGLLISDRVKMSAPQSACVIGDTSGGGSNAPGCQMRPGYCDVGSVDRVALAGLSAGIDWLAERPQRLDECRMHAKTIRDALERIPGVAFFGCEDPQQRYPSIAFSVKHRSLSEIASFLDATGMVVSAGFQCSMLSHQMLGTDEEGLIRISVGPQNGAADIQRAVEILDELRVRIAQ